MFRDSSVFHVFWDFQEIGMGVILMDSFLGFSKYWWMVCHILEFDDS